MKKIENDLDIIRARIDIAGKKILDVGCGTGDLVRKLTREGAEVTGIDSAAVIAKAKTFPPVGGETYLEGGGENLTVPDGAFDAVMLMASLHHVPEAQMDQAVQETRRVVKPGGIVIFVEPVARDGSYTELIRLVEDEERIQQLAYEAIRRAIGKGAAHHSEELVYFERSLQDYKELLDKYVEDEAERTRCYTAAVDITARLSREAGVGIEAFRFKSICRLDQIRYRSPKSD